MAAVSARGASDFILLYPPSPSTPDAVLRPPRLIVVLSLDQLQLKYAHPAVCKGEMLAGTKGSFCVR